MQHNQQAGARPTGTFMLALVALVWVGMVLGVSGLATPIKFQAISLTLPVALDVGQTTFAAFNRLEWLLSFVLVLSVAISRPTLRSIAVYVTVGIVLIVLLQTLWLLPALDLRVQAVIAGEALPPSAFHNLYIVAEGLKLVGLITIGLGALLALWERREEPPTQL